MDDVANLTTPVSSSTPRILGVVSTPLASHESGEPYGKLTTYLRDLIELAEHQGWVAYVFSTRDVLRQRSVVWGWTRRNGRWQRSFFPLPQILYLRTTQLDRADVQVLRWLERTQSVQCINQIAVDELILDRWRLLQICLSHPSLGSRVPDLLLMRPSVTIDEAFASERYLQVLPRYRAAGRYAAGLLERRGDEYSLRLERGSRAETRPFRSTLELRTELEQLFGDVIIQRYIRPLRVEDCPVVLRSVWQRGRDTRWSEQFSVVRVGAKGSLGAAYATVCVLEKFLPVFKQVLPRRVKALTYEFHRTAQLIVDLIDQRAHGAAELAVDCALGQDGSITVLDVSTLGGVYALQRLTAPELRGRYVRQSLDYAAALYEHSFASAVRS